MTEYDISAAIARIETQIDGVVYRIDRREEEWNAIRSDFEMRIRIIERQQSTLSGKLAMIGAGVALFVGVVGAWFSSLVTR